MKIYKTYDKTTSILWLLLSVAVVIQSVRMGIGSLSNPGMGFMAFGSAAIMGILSLIQFFQSIIKKKKTKKTEPVSSSPFAGILLWRVIGSGIALLLYAVLLPVTGYLIATFLLMAWFLILVKKFNWQLLIIFPVITSIVSYYIFSKLFNVLLPIGLLGF